ncbi:hypothetical protein SRHO_G00312620 [Serrasalmus rhombeus]
MSPPASEREQRDRERARRDEEGGEEAEKESVQAGGEEEKRLRLSQIERSELETLRELELRQLSELRALESESRSSDREPHTPARKMDALQQPWTGAGQQGLLPLHSQNVVDLHIEDIHLMITSDAQKPSKLFVLEETMRRNAAKILQLKEEEEELKRELEELKLRMASMIKSREEDRLPELGLQRGMKRQIRMGKKLHAMKRELEREQEEQWKQAEERLREMEKRMMEERESIERREEKWREMLKKAEEEWGQIDEPSLDTKEPERNKKQKAYVLDFNGRVKKGAVKNFQLTCPANPDEKVIQFGRVDEDHFLQDCSFHLCTLQAFAITSSDLNTVYTCTIHTSLSP